MGTVAWSVSDAKFYQSIEIALDGGTGLFGIKTDGFTLIEQVNGVDF
jgi:hypothetical protein